MICAFPLVYMRVKDYTEMDDEALWVNLLHCYLTYLSVSPGWPAQTSRDFLNPLKRSKAIFQCVRAAREDIFMTHELVMTFLLFLYPWVSVIVLLSGGIACYMYWDTIQFSDICWQWACEASWHTGRIWVPLYTFRPLGLTINWWSRLNVADVSLE
jgi:hypothetical protein